MRDLESDPTPLKEKTSMYLVPGLGPVGAHGVPERREGTQKKTKDVEMGKFA